MSPLRICLLCSFAGIAMVAAPKPPHDIWLEGEACEDHDFTTIGRHPNFRACYGGAILQLQDQRSVQEGRHATYRATLPNAGWWEVRVATTAPSLCPFSVQVGDCRERRFTSLRSEQRYGHDKLFGWYLVGRFQLPAGETAITLRSRDRRATERDHLLYIDALSLRHLPEAPVSRMRWLAPAGAGDAILEKTFAATALGTPAVSVLCDGQVAVELNGEALGTVKDAQEPWHGVADKPLRATGNTLRFRFAPGQERALLARVTADGEQGARTIVCHTDGTWKGNPQVLGDAFAKPWGDATIFPPAKLPVGRLPIPVKTGNLSVDLLRQAARGNTKPKPGPLPQLPDWKRFGGISSVEDYICWLPLEPARDQFDWSFYENNCRELAKQGMGYSVYPWLHFPPKWALGSDLWEPLLCNQHGKSTLAPSIWSPQTRRIFERFYRELHRQFGDRIDQVYLGMVADYGEIGYPIGMASWVVPSAHIHPGFWCADRQARQDFRERMLAQYGTLAALNAAWGTAFATPETIDYPPGLDAAGPPDEWLASPRNRRRWLDFAAWYLQSMEQFAEEAVAISRRYFPERPHELKIGFGSEQVCLGSDPTLYVSRSRPGRFTVRSTHGKLSPYFYRRFSSAAKHYAVPLVTEPPGSVSREEEVERLFKDATSGTTEYFEYAGNLIQASDLLRRFGPYMEGKHSLTNLAFFVPTADHRLHPRQGNPMPVVRIANACRDAFDWDLVDEQLVRDGALERYGVLFLVAGNVIERDVLDHLAAWVRRGGVLVATDFGAIETVEGDQALASSLFVEPMKLPPADQIRKPQATPLPACFLDIGSAGDGPFLVGDWHGRESGHYEWGGPAGGITKRWSGPRPCLRVPVAAGTRHHLAIAVARHPKCLKLPCDVQVGGKTIGSVAAARTSVFRAEIPATMVAPDGLLHVDLLPQSWQPSVVDGTSDTRQLGVAVRWFKVWQDGQEEPAEPVLPNLRWQLDLQALAKHARKPLGKGFTLRIPADSTQTAACAQFLAQIVAAGPRLLPERACWPQLDGMSDGVWTALLPNRILFYNPKPAAIPLNLTLSPAAFARAGLAQPGHSKIALAVPPHALASVELPSCQVRRP